VEPSGSPGRQIADAAESFEAAAERAPGQPKEWMNLAAHQYAYGDPRKAVESLKRAQNPRSVNLNASDVHPNARRLMADAQRLMSMK
jgi:Flp pilus assembly protein TadD